MLLGRVIGTVWATRKDEKLEGLRFLIVQEVDLELAPQGGFVVAVDSVQSGVGEIVLVARGSSARQTRLTENTPVDAVIMASVDNLEFSDPKVLEAEYQQRQAEIQSQLAGYQES